MLVISAQSLPGNALRGLATGQTSMVGVRGLSSQKSVYWGGTFVSFMVGRCFVAIDEGECVIRFIHIAGKGLPCVRYYRQGVIRRFSVSKPTPRESADCDTAAAANLCFVLVSLVALKG